MFVTSEKIKVAEVKNINYEKDGEEKVLHILTIGDVITGITEDIVIPKNKIDLIKDIKSEDTIRIKLKNERRKFCTKPNYKGEMIMLSNGIREHRLKCIISDAMTGEIIMTLPCNRVNANTVGQVIKDLIEADHYDKHGILIKYGIEP